MVKLLLLVGLIVACWLILGTQANEYLDFNVTEIDRNEELEFGFSKYSSNLNPLLVGLTLIRGADSGAGTLSASVTRSLFIYFFFMCSFTFLCVLHFIHFNYILLSLFVCYVSCPLPDFNLVFTFTVMYYSRFLLRIMFL